MESATRLKLAARVSYYFAFLCALLGILLHFGTGKAMFLSIGVSQRNLFEASLLLFLISATSALRAGIATKAE
jgi:uncharacterized membrane protein